MRLLRILPPLHVPALVALCTLLAAGCGSGGGGPFDPGVTKVGACLTGGGPPITISGTVLYTRLVFSPPGGVGPATETRPARFVDVDVRLAGGGDCYGRTSTDAAGNYSITLMPPEGGAALEVAVFSRTLEDPAREILVHEADPPFVNAHSETDVFAYASGPIASNASATVDLTVPYGGGPANRPGIGFGLLDTAITCWDGITAELGGVLPPAHIYSRIGNNAALSSSSYYAPGSNSMAILGGAAGNPDNSDTDYFDDPVVAHEFGHFVENSISHTLTRGGFHGGEPLEPGFAWSEGFATGLGCLLLGQPDYVDSVTTAGAALFAFDIEDVTSFDPPGIGGEFTVAEIVWDLADGGAGPADVDGDAAAVPLQELLTAYVSFNKGLDAPYLGLFLDRITGAPGASINVPTMTALLSGPPTENQGVTYPLTGTDIWPRTIGFGGSDAGTVDSLPGLSKNQCRGITSSAWYQITLPTAAVVTINLTSTPIIGNGDLDLFLFPNSNVQTPIASSASGGAAPESINASLNAGTYILIVEAYCGGGGTRASYNLTVN